MRLDASYIAIVYFILWYAALQVSYNTFCPQVIFLWCRGSSAIRKPIANSNKGATWSESIYHWTGELFAATPALIQIPLFHNHYNSTCDAFITLQRSPNSPLWKNWGYLITANPDISVYRFADQLPHVRERLEWNWLSCNHGPSTSQRPR